MSWLDLRSGGIDKHIPDHTVDLLVLSRSVGNRFGEREQMLVLVIDIEFDEEAFIGPIFNFLLNVAVLDS